MGRKRNFAFSKLFRSGQESQIGIFQLKAVQKSGSRSAVMQSPFVPSFEHDPCRMNDGICDKADHRCCGEQRGVADFEAEEQGE